MHNETQTLIGTILNDAVQKDAIHIAVYPATSEHKVFPGQWVALVKDGVVTPSDDKPIGIVDPFLAGSVFPGARFFVFITPNTITGMRHEWTHPAFHISIDDHKNWRDSFRDVDNFWHHIEIVTGVRTNPENVGNPFCCSC